MNTDNKTNGQDNAVMRTKSDEERFLREHAEEIIEIFPPAKLSLWEKTHLPPGVTFAGLKEKRDRAATEVQVLEKQERTVGISTLTSVLVFALAFMVMSQIRGMHRGLTITPLLLAIVILAIMFVMTIRIQERRKSTKKSAQETEKQFLSYAHQFVRSVRPLLHGHAPLRLKIRNREEMLASLEALAELVVSAEKAVDTSRVDMQVPAFKLKEIIEILLQCKEIYDSLFGINVTLEYGVETSGLPFSNVQRRLVHLEKNKKA